MQLSTRNRKHGKIIPTTSLFFNRVQVGGAPKRNAVGGFRYNLGMEFIHFTATADDEGRRLDRAARRLVGGGALGGVFGAIRKGLVRVNGERSGADRRISAGDDISVAAFLIEGGDREAAPKAPGIPGGIVLFRNEHLLVVDKPYGIPVQPARNAPTALSEMVASEFRGESVSFRPGPLHRLDRRTTGALAFSQSLAGAREFSRAMRAGEIGKSYLALVSGEMRRAEEWRDAIGKAAESGGQFRTVEVGGPGREAVTIAEPEAFGEVRGTRATLVRMTIRTGRTHQIRAQSAAHGFPLLGDSAYGSRAGALTAEREFFLHARTLTLGEACSARLGAPVRIEAPVPAEIGGILAGFSS